jgi:hypothetical protein
MASSANRLEISQLGPFQNVCRYSGSVVQKKWRPDHDILTIWLVGCRPHLEVTRKADGSTNYDQSLGDSQLN